jgi:hypothetical protein
MGVVAALRSAVRLENGRGSRESESIQHLVGKTWCDSVRGEKEWHASHLDSLIGR